MSHLGDELAFVPENFSGRARLFPLPNLVLFPHVVQPLHIFEPRYVQLLEEAIEDDRLIAMALLNPGWEGDYEGRPPIAPIACLGRVVTWQAQGDKHYNLLLHGLKRVRITRELPPKQLFRAADVQVLDDVYPPGVTQMRRKLQRDLIRGFQKMLPHIKDADEMFNQLAIDRVSLGLLTDVIAYAMNLDLGVKQGLLAETNVDSRARTLLACLEQPTEVSAADSGAVIFPPEFSTN